MDVPVAVPAAADAAALWIGFSALAGMGDDMAQFYLIDIIRLMTAKDR